MDQTAKTQKHNIPRQERHYETDQSTLIKKTIYTERSDPHLTNIVCSPDLLRVSDCRALNFLTVFPRQDSLLR